MGHVRQLGFSTFNNIMLSYSNCLKVVEYVSIQISAVYWRVDMATPNHNTDSIHGINAAFNSSNITLEGKNLFEFVDRLQSISSHIGTPLLWSNTVQRISWLNEEHRPIRKTISNVIIEIQRVGYLLSFSLVGFVEFTVQFAAFQKMFNLFCRTCWWLVENSETRSSSCSISINPFLMLGKCIFLALKVGSWQ